MDPHTQETEPNRLGRGFEIPAVLTTERVVYSPTSKVDFIWVMSGIELPDRWQIPILWSHKDDIDDPILGSCRDLRIEQNRLCGMLCFDAVFQQAAKVFGLATRGHLEYLSAGIHEYDRLEIPANESREIQGVEYKAAEQRPLVLITRWRPIEISVLHNPGDVDARMYAELLPKVR